jgi:molybdate transport system substrate-binding protein
MLVRVAMRTALLIVAALASGIAAAADELKVLSAAAVKGPATEVAEQFARDGGQRVAFEFTTAGQVDEKLAAGARPDVVINTRARIATRTGASAANSPFVRDLGTVSVGVAVRAGAPRPDLTSIASFRESLLRAQSIAYTDPARGGTVGSQFAKVIDDLGLRAALARKVVLAADGLDVVRKVGRGEVELGITQVSEILHIDAAAYVGSLPDALHLTTTYAAWVPDSGNATARKFVETMTSERGRERFRKAGFD